MKTMAITSKRQATLPAELCRDLGVGPGDHLQVERRTVDGETLWILRAPKPSWAWFGALKKYGVGKSHDREAIEASIVQAIGDSGES